MQYVTQAFRIPPDEEIMPFEYFKQMYRDEVIENFVEQSNLYRVQKTGRPLNTNKNEMEQFLGIHIMLGIVNMPSYRTYWADSTRFDQFVDVTKPISGKSVWHHEKLFTYKR